jgi:hypothetical protein
MPYISKIKCPERVIYIDVAKVRLIPLLFDSRDAENIDPSCSRDEIKDAKKKAKKEKINRKKARDEEASTANLNHERHVSVPTTPRA